MDDTKFAPATRSSKQAIDAAWNTIITTELFVTALNLFPEVVLLLDRNRQTVYCNEPLLRLVGVDTPETILGKRPGEIFHCIHANEEPGGCGTSEFCRECGGTLAILTAQTGRKAVNECRITVYGPNGNERPLDLRVWAIPVDFKNMPLTFYVIRDIQDEKRRAALERVFFHDILNDAAILKGYAENAKDGLLDKNEDAFAHISRFTDRLANSILEQRDLLAAEEGTYSVKVQEVTIANIFQELRSFYEKHPIARNKTIRTDIIPSNATLTTDPVLLWRILGNLTKNALEAAAQDDTITLIYQEETNQKRFSVHNPSVMTDSVRHQIFQRSFSTKGQGRGLGTYSVKLFTEQYLKGKVWFESVEGKGTTFFVAFQAPQA